MTYKIPFTIPSIILSINPGSHVSILPTHCNNAIIFGLNLLVSYVITNQGDGPIPAPGLSFGAPGIGITINSHLPGTGLDIRYGQAASVLRGIWELTALIGVYTLSMEIFVGDLRPANYRGHVKLYLRVADDNATTASAAPGFTGAVRLMA
ncbi:hypothetical protein ABVK25_010463 [Lepraria finkii]|uniref:Uncharacterized protein n=1 Tax=Lepraria finkii TaxID=1340010 RepID=A0ABR4AUW8_9LECA